MRTTIARIIILTLTLLVVALAAGCGKGHRAASFSGGKSTPPKKEKPKAGGITYASALKTTSGVPTGVRVTWVRETASNIGGYYFYKDMSSIPDSAVGNGSLRVNGGSLFPQPSSGVFLTFDDAFAAVTGQTYYYRLTAVDTDGDESNFSNEMSITIAAHSITSFSPSGGRYGDSVDIYGLHFGTQNTVTDSVLFSGVIDSKVPASLSPGKITATILSWTDTHIQVTVPMGAITGPISVVVATLSVDTATNFTIISPYISQITPDHGIPGTLVTLDGANFGAARGTSTVTFNGMLPNPSDYVTWNSVQIQVKAPPSTTGPVVVHVGAQTSNPVVFSYDPAISLVSPQRRIAGDVITITGVNFGSGVGGHVAFNGVTVPSASASSWADTSITLAIPTGAKPIGAVIVNDGAYDSLPYLYHLGIVSNGTVNPPVGFYGMDLGNPNSVAIDGTGYPLDLTIDQSSESYKIARDTTTGWVVEPFAPGASAGGYPFLTYDATGAPPALYATYFDGTTGTQRLAINSGAGWAYEDVPPPPSTTGFYGSFSSVHVSSASPEIHVAYQYYSFTTFSYVLAYAHRPITGGSWTTEIVDSTPSMFVGAWCKISTTSTGVPVIAYQAGTQLRYAEKPAATWTITTVAGGGSANSGDYISLGLDAANVPYIVYRETTTGYEGIKCSFRSGASWTTEEIQSDVSGNQLLYPSMQLDSTGQPRVAFTYLNSTFSTYTQKGAYRYIVDPPPGPLGDPPPFPVWAFDVNPYPGVGQYSSMVLASGDVGYICSYYPETTDVSFTTYSVTPPPPPGTGSNQPGIWTNDDVADQVLLGGVRFGDHSLVYDSQGYAKTVGITTHTAAIDEASYFTETATGWQREVLTGPFGNVQYLCLALDENDDPHVALYDAIGGPGSVYYGVKSGGSWTWQSVYTGSLSGPIGIALGALSTQQVRIAVNDSTANALYCFISDNGGTTWDTQTVHAGGVRNDALSLTVDYATSRPVVATNPVLGTSAPPTVYAYQGGGVWSASTVDVGDASLISVWMMSNDAPAVVYMNFTGGNNWLYYASYDPINTSWSKTQLSLVMGTPTAVSLDVYNDSTMTDQPLIAIQPDSPQYWGVYLWFLSGGTWTEGNTGRGPYEGLSLAIKGMTNGEAGLVFDDQAQYNGYSRGPIFYWSDVPTGGG